MHIKTSVFFLLSISITLNMFAMDIEKIEQFKNQLEAINKFANDMSNHQMPTEEREQGVKIAQEYYTFLKNNNEKYGEAALKVVNDEGIFGKIANIHLRTQAVFEGVEREYLPELRDRIIIGLAYSDMEKRIEKKEQFNYETISLYHKEVFKSQGLTEYAWGGLAVEELLGIGKWMALFDSNISVFSGIINQLPKIKNQESHYALDRLVTSIKHSFSCYALFEHDYAPMVRAGNTAQAALWFAVDESRIKKERDDISSELLGAESYYYKIMPKKELKNNVKDNIAHILKSCFLKLDNIIKNFVRTKCKEAEEYAQKISSEGSAKIKEFNQHAQQEFDKEKSRLTNELLSESKQKSATIKASAAHSQVKQIIYVDNLDIHARKQDELEKIINEDSIRTKAFIDSVKDETKKLIEQNDNKVRNITAVVQQNIDLKKGQLIKTIKQKLNNNENVDNKLIEEEIKEMVKQFLETVDKDINESSAQ